MRERSSIPTPTLPVSMRQMCDLLLPTIRASFSCESPCSSRRSRMALPSASLFCSIFMHKAYVLVFVARLHIRSHKGIRL